VTTAVRTRADIEADIRKKRAERELYVSPDGLNAIHAQINELIDEWVAASPPSDS